MKEFGFQQKHDYILSEAQFVILEDQIANQLKKQKMKADAECAEDADFVEAIEIVSGIRERLGITLEIHKLLFSDEEGREQALDTIQFYN